MPGLGGRKGDLSLSKASLDLSRTSIRNLSIEFSSKSEVGSFLDMNEDIPQPQEDMKPSLR